MAKRIQCKVIKSIKLKNNTGHLCKSEDIYRPASYQTNIKYAQRHEPIRNNISYGHYNKFISGLSVPDDGIGQLLDFHL